jgi:hypothetical protein
LIDLIKCLRIFSTLYLKNILYYIYIITNIYVGRKHQNLNKIGTVKLKKSALNQSNCKKNAKQSDVKAKYNNIESSFLDAYNHSMIFKN